MARDRSRSPDRFIHLEIPVYDVSSGDDEDPSEEETVQFPPPQAAPAEHQVVPDYSPTTPPDYSPTPREHATSGVPPSPRRAVSPVPDLQAGPSTRRGPIFRVTARKSVRRPSPGRAPTPPAPQLDEIRRQFEEGVHQQLVARTEELRREVDTSARLRVTASAWQFATWMSTSFYYRLALEMQEELAAISVPTAAQMEQLRARFAQRTEETRIQVREWEAEAERKGSISSSDED